MIIDLFHIKALDCASQNHQDRKLATSKSQTYYYILLSTFAVFRCSSVQAYLFTFASFAQVSTLLIL